MQYSELLSRITALPVVFGDKPVTCERNFLVTRIEEGG